MLNIDNDLRDLFKSDSVQKTIRVHFPNGEFDDLTNSNLIAESFSFDESIIRGDDFKFGLCEASSVTFECFDFGNCNNMEIEVSIEVAGYDPVPFGRFVVDSCKRQSNLTRRKIVAYSTGGEQFSLDGDLITYLTRDGLNQQIWFDSAIYKTLGVKFIDMMNNIEQIETRKELIEQINFYSAEGYTMILNVEAIYLPFTGISEYDSGYIQCTFTNDYIDKLRNLRNIVENGNLDHKNTILSQIDLAINNYLVVFGVYNQGDVGFEYAQKIKDCYCNLLFVYNNPKDTDYVIQPNIISKFTLTCVNDQSYNMDIDVFTNCDTYFGKFINNTGALISGDMLKSSSPLDILQSYAEINASFGRQNRYGNYEFTHLSKFELQTITPSDILYPGNDLYPGRVVYSDVISKNLIHRFWYEEYISKKFGTIVVNYKDSDGADKTLAKRIGDGENTYYFDDNVLFDGIITDEAQIESLILNNFVPYLNDFQAIPIELTMKGLPYFEAGDQIVIQTDEGPVTTYIFNRTIKGIHSLRDTIRTDCEEMNEPYTGTIKEDEPESEEE